MKVIIINCSDLTKNPISITLLRLLFDEKIAVFLIKKQTKVSNRTFVCSISTLQL